MVHSRRDGAHYAAASPGSSLVTVHGANHNGYNAQWSPATVRPDAVDDADYLKPARPECKSGRPGRLAEAEQVDVAADAVGAFLDASFGDASAAADLRRAAARHRGTLTVS